MDDQERQDQIRNLAVAWENIHRAIIALHKSDTGKAKALVEQATEMLAGIAMRISS